MRARIGQGLPQSAHQNGGSEVVHKEKNELQKNSIVHGISVSELRDDLWGFITLIVGRVGATTAMKPAIERLVQHVF
jgi:hypothetical protein